MSTYWFTRVHGGVRTKNGKINTRVFTRIFEVCVYLYLKSLSIRVLQLSVYLRSRSRLIFLFTINSITV